LLFLDSWIEELPMIDTDACTGELPMEGSGGEWHAYGLVPTLGVMTDSPEVVMPPSYSATAILAGVLAILSTATCIGATLATRFVSPVAGVVILPLPAVGLVAAILGGAALRSIRRSGGTLGGRPPALIGVFVGLASAVLQGSFSIAALATYWPVRTVLAPAVETMMTQGAQHDFDAVRMALSPAASEALDDARMRMVFEGLHSRAGAFESASFGLDVLRDSHERLRALARSARGSVDQVPKPIGMKFASTRIIAYVFVDQDALGKNQVQIADILFLLPDDTAACLLADGPAAKIAQVLRIAVTIP